jgi:hypothetical protein
MNVASRPRSLLVSRRGRPLFLVRQLAWACFRLAVDRRGPYLQTNNSRNEAVVKSKLDWEISRKKPNDRAPVAAIFPGNVWRRLKAGLRFCCWLPALLGSMGGIARADQATLQETYSERYACWWDCPFDIDDLGSIPDLDRDELREEYCERICAERLRVAASLKLVLTLPTLRHTDLRTAGGLSLAAGGLEFSLDEASKSSSNSITFLQYREVENDHGAIIQLRSGTVVFSKKGDVLTVSASRTTAGESMVAGQFTHQTGTTHGAINVDVVPVRVEVGGLIVEREIPFKALTTLKTSLVRVELEDEAFEEDPEVIEELRTFSTVKVSGTAAWTNPILTVTTPMPSLRWSNQVIAASGTVVSLAGESSVWLQFNQADEWIQIPPTNGLWDVLLELKPGTNRIFACAVDNAGRFSPGILVNFSHVRTSPLGLEVGPSLAVGSLTGAANGQWLEEGVIYRLTPVPAPGHLFEKWELQSPISGTIEIAGVTAPQLAFVHETNLNIRAHFVPNRFLAIRNKFAGLVRPSSGTNLPGEALDQGLITLQLSDSGALEGSYVTARGQLAFVSQIHPTDGTARFILDGGKVTEATASLAFDLDTGRWVSGALTGASAEWTSVVEAYPAASPEEVAPLTGSHTFIIPGVDLPYAASLPAGYGFGALKISAKGDVKGVGAAGDGTSLVFNVPLVKHTDGISTPRYFWPLFQSKRRGEMILRGFMEVSITNTLDTASPLHWTKQANFQNDFYPIGFDDARFAGAGGLREWMTARYLVPGRGTNTPGFVNAQLTLVGGNLPAPLEFNLSITPEDKVTVTGPNAYQLTLKFTRSIGGFTGTLLHPVTGKKTKLTGSILQSDPGSSGANTGFGWFPGWSQTGAVILEKADAP